MTSPLLQTFNPIEAFPSTIVAPNGSVVSSSCDFAISNNQKYVHITLQLCISQNVICADHVFKITVAFDLLLDLISLSTYITIAILITGFL